MAKLYEIELDRNERDFTTFLKSRKVSLSRQDFRVLIAAEGVKKSVSLFDTEQFRNKLLGNKLRNKNKKTRDNKNRENNREQELKV